MTTILNGVLGGLLVGLVATVVTRIVGGGSATAGGGDSRGATSRASDVAGHVLYGGLAGGLLVALELYVLHVLAVPPAVGRTLAVAVAWSALLFGTLLVVSRVGPTPPFDRATPGELLAYHLVYGPGLGVWIRMTWIT